MKKNNSEKASKSNTRGTTKTPERDEIRDEHPNLDDDSGAWSDHDNDWVLDGRMPN